MGPGEDKRLLQLAGAISLFTTNKLTSFSAAGQPRTTSSSPAV